MKRWPQYDAQQIEAVAAVLRSGEVNAWTGPQVSIFEKTYAAHLNRAHAIALANGTLALELALRSIGISPGDEVIVSPRSFMASASCVPFVGGTPVFADVDPDSGNLTATGIAAAITPQTRAVILVHLAGWPCDLDPIVDLCASRGIILIEDCAQAHGATYKGRPVGSFGDFAAFSFCQDKIITTGGEGGLLALDSDTYFDRAWGLKDHGKSRFAVFHKPHPPGFRWLHESFGSNWRMTSLQAVIGQIQLGRLADWTAQRRRNAAILVKTARLFGALHCPQVPQDREHAFYRYYTYVRPERLKPGWSRDRIMAQINAQGVACFSGSCSEIYLERAFQRSGLGPSSRLPIARLLGETSLAFLVDPCLDTEDMNRTAAVLHEVMTAASR